MKYKYILILTILSIGVKAQSFWSFVDNRVEHNKSHVTDMALFTDSVILVCGHVSDASCPFHQLFAFNVQGEKLWNKDGFHEVVCTDTNYIYTAGYSLTGDVASLWHLEIAKYDKEGNVVFNIQYPEIPHDFSFVFEPRGIDITKNGNIVVATLKSVVSVDINGENISEHYLLLESAIQSIYSLGSASFLITAGNKIYKTGADFILSDSVSFENNIIKTIIKNDTAYVLFGTNLILLDSTLTTLGTFVLSTTDVFEDMEIYDDCIWVKTKNSENIKLLKINKRNEIKSLVVDALLNVKDFLVIDSSYTFIGNTFSNQIGIYNYSYEHSSAITPILHDIEIIDFDISDISHVYVSSLDDSFAIGYNFNTELSIKNNGNDTINSFSVFSDLHGGFNCAQNFIYEKFTDLAILPGQLKTVNLKRAFEYSLHNNEICFECLAPDSSLETKTDNNFLCKTFKVTGIDNNSEYNNKIYPNPFSNYIIIDMPAKRFNSFELTDINGAINYKGSLTLQQSMLEFNNLNPGLYVLKLISNDCVESHLLLKQ